jgi:L-rhamnose isomerase / sugar isomerase
MQEDLPLPDGFVRDFNASRDIEGLQDDYQSLARQLRRRGIDIEPIRRKVAAFSVALPTWGAGRGGTRFAKFPFDGAPTSIYEKLADCAVVQQLCRITPRVSPHFPWDCVADYVALRELGASLALGFDAVNSNTFQDQLEQKHSYSAGSLSSAQAAVRDQAVDHNIECIRIGKILGSKAITVWVGDGSNFPGQQDFTRAFDRYLASAARIYAALPGDWKMLLEHKLFEPAFYSSVLQDWGSSILAAQQLGERAYCLVDLGHHAPTTNIEQIVARLHRFGKLGGFHFNDSKYGDDDLDSGAINPHQLFLVFNELIEAESNAKGSFEPAYLIDQSHNVTDPIESMLASAEAIVCAFAKALIVDREALLYAQESNDVMMAFQSLRQGYRTDVTPLIAQARIDAGGAIDVLGAFRASGWRKTQARRRQKLAPGTGIV